MVVSRMEGMWGEGEVGKAGQIYGHGRRLDFGRRMVRDHTIECIDV